MGRKTIAWVFAGVGFFILLVVGVSLLVFPDSWPKTPQGVLGLIVAAAVGGTAFVKGILDILKAVKDLTEKPKPTARVDTGGGAHVGGDAKVGGDLVGRDQITAGQIIYNLPPGETAPSPVTDLHQLPNDLADFTGRADQLVRIRAALLDGGCVTINGVGGMGKSTLAIHAAYGLCEVYPDAQLVVNMRGMREDPLAPERAMAEVIRGFAPEEKLPESVAELAPLYRQALTGKRVLLILDDARDVSQVRDLVPPARCGLLVTSWRRIMLPGAECIDLGAFEPEEAVALLQVISEREGEDAALEEIAALCVCLPLALRAAGSYLAQRQDWTAAEYSKALSDERERLRRLHVEDVDVEAVLALSARRLVREQRDLALRWEALSVMPAPFDRAAAAAVWEVEDETAHVALSELVAWAVLSYDTVRRLYDLHALLRPLARRTFELADERGNCVADRLWQAERRHAEHYLQVGSAADDRYLEGGVGVMEGLRVFDAAWSHLEAAWARMAGRAEAARWVCRFPDQMAYVLNLRLSPRRRISYLEAALDTARILQDRKAEGVHLGNLGLAFADIGDARRAIECYEQVLTIAREAGARSGEGAALGNLGLAYADLGNARRAIENYDQALIIAREIGDRRGEGNRLGNLGLAYADLGNARRAIEYYDQALMIAREIGDRRGEGNRLGNLGSAYADLGDVRHAIEYYEQALALAREIGDRRGEGNRLGSLGNAYAALGDAQRAIEHYEQALVILREIGDRLHEGNALGSLGIAYADLGDPRRAIEHFEQALVIAREIGNRRGEGNHLGNLGLAYAALGDAQEAIEHYEQALVIAREIGDRRGEGNHLGNLGLAYAAIGEVRRAIEHHEQGLVVAREIGDRRGEEYRLGSLGNDYAAFGDARRAIQYYVQALVIAREIGDRHGEGAGLGSLGNAYAALGDAWRAIEVYGQVLVIARETGNRRAEANASWNLALQLAADEPARAAELMQACVDYEREIGHLDAEQHEARLAEVRARLAEKG